MWLQDQGIDDNNHGVVRVRQARELSEDGGGVGRGQGIRDASEGLDTTTDVAGARQRVQ